MRNSEKQTATMLCEQAIAQKYYFFKYEKTWGCVVFFVIVVHVFVSTEQREKTEKHLHNIKYNIVRLIVS